MRDGQGYAIRMCGLSEVLISPHVFASRPGGASLKTPQYDLQDLRGRQRTQSNHILMP